MLNIKVAILESGKAYLPEISAYVKYLNENGITTLRVSDERSINLEEFDLVWKFMGVDIKPRMGVKVIHEYNSLTIGRLGTFKDRVKKVINCKPQARIFLNESIKEKYNFDDGIPSLIRDMGIADEFFDNENEKEFDFVYIGAMDSTRNISSLLNSFSNKDCKVNIALIGTPEEELYNKFSHCENIKFLGRVPYEEVPEIASKAEFGINFIPDFYPYNIQTSTKLLEYCALGLKVITTDYKWVNDFEKKENASFYKISSISEELNFDEIKQFNFITPNVEKYRWNNILNNSQVLNFVTKIINTK